MRLITFVHQGETRVGCLDRESVGITDLGDVAPDMLALVEQGSEGLARARDAAGRQPSIPMAEVRLAAPIPAPRRNIMCVGKNYYEHAKEFDSSGFDASSGGQVVSEFPVIFSKSAGTVSATGDDIPIWLDTTNSVDYEGELAVVIGVGGRGISKARSSEHIFGFTIINDVTSRTLQRQHKQWFIGKNIDGFCPMGPAIATPDEVGDIREAQLTTKVNGELRQNARIRDLIFDIPTLIETISATTTLVPGDIIATGTPAGVGIGFDPPRFLDTGDVVTIEITGIGVLENTAVGRGVSA